MYQYATERPWLFTEEGQVALLKVRDHVAACLAMAGAVRIIEALKPVSSEYWRQMAILDRLVELGELREITGPEVMGQHRVFVDARRP